MSSPESKFPAPDKPELRALILVVERNPIVQRLERFFLEQAGFSVSEAPTAFSTFRRPGILDLLPCPEGLELSHAFVHEIIGLGWYHALHMAKGR